MDATNIPNDLVSAKDAGRQLGVSAGSIRRWIASGSLPGFKVGGRLRVSLADVVAMVERVEPTDGPRIETRREVAAREAADDATLRAAGVRR